MSDSSNNGHHAEDAIPAELQEHANGLSAYHVLGQYLSEDGWFPTPLEDTHTYRMYYSGEHGELRCYAIVRVDLEQLLIYAVAGVKVEEGQRVAVAEFLTRANYGLRIGNFELDFADGEVRYKSSLDFEGEPLSDNLIRNAIYPAVRIMDEYLPGLMKVAFGGAAPADAIREIEG
jgi:hypothetical protein